MKYTKANVLKIYDGFNNVKKWINELDEAIDQLLLKNLEDYGVPDGSSFGYKEVLDEDLKKADLASDLKKDMKADPELLNEKYKPAKYQNEFAEERVKEGDDGWKEFGEKPLGIKVLKGLGKKFEGVCLTQFKNQSSAWFQNLAQKVFNDYGKNLAEYDLFSQVQLYYDGSKYFVCDQVFVKFIIVNGQEVIEDVIVIENKLKEGTHFTKHQKGAKKKNSYKVRSVQQFSELNTNKTLTQGNTLTFDNSQIKWYKAYDGGTGNSISDIIKLQ